MAVVIETTLGDITVDLYLEQRPVTCLNFLKLCKMKYYNFNLFHMIRSGFIAQTGDPTGEGSGGQSIFGVLEGPEKRFFSGEKMPKIRHTDAGLISMVCTGDMMVGSQFFFTLAPDLDSLDGVHCVIGEVTEGQEVLRMLNDVICDEGHRPYRDVRITHTVVLEDPFNDPLGFRVPSRSPSPNGERLRGGRIAPDEEIDELGGKSAAEIQEIIEEKEAKARATILEIVGDLPDAEIAPPENVLFVCKLNPVTTDDDLEIIFSRFGKIVSCEVIRDKKTGDSLQYAFIEFSDKKSCEDAYFKMDNVLIDDRRIHVDFSQSVSKMKWLGKGRGVKYFDDIEKTDINVKTERSKLRSRSRDRKNNKDHGTNSNNYSNNKINHRHQDRERHADRHHKHENNLTEKSHSHRSRSRSRVEKHKGVSRDEKRNHSYDHNRNSEKYKKDYKEHSNKTGNEKCKVSSRAHKTKPPSRNSRTEKTREYQDKDYHEIEKYRTDRSNKQVENSQEKHNIGSNKESYKSNSKSDKKIIEPRTPSPIINKKKTIKQSDKKDETNKNESNKNINKKKKRKQSVSSSESSSESSSSSGSSSSSDNSRKKKTSSKRRKKKYSTSSTSSSDSTSSSSSSSESSSSSSSSSDSDTKKNRKNKKKKL